MNERILKEVQGLIKTHMFLTIPEPALLGLLNQYDSFPSKWAAAQNEHRITLICDLLASTLLKASWPTSTNPDTKKGFFRSLVHLIDKNEWELTNRAGISFILWLEGCADCGVKAKRVKYKRCTRCSMLHKERVADHVAERNKLKRPQPRPKPEELKSWFELKGMIRASIRGERSGS